ncbi:MAG: hypothetical protein K8R36_16810 [Planctomycetales bacterium]|nr:hypothetical protein [Planctomycetales bacterium]
MALWSFVGVCALACVLFIAWHSNSSHQAKVAPANDQISEAVAAANEWITGNSSLDGEAIEQRLADALQDDDATEKANGVAALAQVRQRREQFAEEARIEQAEQEATVAFKDAKKRLDARDVAAAIQLLRKYVSDPYATEKADAQRLLAEAETAVSDSQTIDALVAMEDGDFDRVKAAGEIRDGKVTHPALTASRTETIQRNLKQAAQQREAIRIAEEKRREKERLSREHAEWLRTRTPDVRNVCWGDSLQTVKQVEDIPLKQEGDSLSGKVEFYGREANLSYSFYDDKLVKVFYWISFGESGNPFELDVPLRTTLEDKYGKGKTDTFGISLGGIDTSAASRETVWDLPRHNIELKASSFDGRHGRNIFLTYEAKTAEARAYKEQEKRKSDESFRKGQEKLKKNL